MSTYKFVVKVKVPFKKSRKEVKKWLKETLEDNSCYIPLYSEHEVIEDCGEKTKIKVKDEKDNQRGTDGFYVENSLYFS